MNKVLWATSIVSFVDFILLSTVFFTLGQWRVLILYYNISTKLKYESINLEKKIIWKLFVLFWFISNKTMLW